MLNLKNSNIIIVSHVLTSVPAADLEEYFLKRKIKNLFFIGHPLFYRADRPGSHYRIYKNGSLSKTKVFKPIRLPSFIQYAVDTITTIIWVLLSNKKWDLIISLDNLNTIAALFLKKIGLVKKVVYYTIDFTPKRFNNNLLNNIYHYLDKFCVENADMTWNVSPRMAEGREKIRGMNRGIYNKQVTVPIGIWFGRFKKLPFNKKNKNTLVYAGGLSPHQGIQLVLDAVPIIIKSIPDFKFIIIGMGDYETELKKKIVSLKIQEYINFLGYIEKHEDVEKILSNCRIAVAMYSKELSKWSYYADPSKIKTYLASGLPVITTNLTHIASDLEKRECGMVISYNKAELAKAIIELFKNEKKYISYRQNAINFAEEFDWNAIFDKNILQILK